MDSDRTSTYLARTAWLIRRAIRRVGRSDLLDLVIVCLLFLPIFLRNFVGGPPEEFWGDHVGQSDYLVWATQYQTIFGAAQASWYPPSSIPMWVIWPSPFVVLHALLYLLVKDVWLLVQVVQVSQLILGVFSMYFLSRKILTRRVARYVATLTYVAAPFFQGQMAHHLFLAWGYAILPFSCLLLMRYVRVRSLRSVVPASLSIAVLLMSSPQAGYYLGLPLWVFSVTYAMFSSRGLPRRVAEKSRAVVAATAIRNLTTFLKAAILSIVPFGLAFLAVGFYLVPTIFDYFPFRPSELGPSGRPLWYGGDPVSFATLQYFELIPFLSEPLSPVFLLVPAYVWTLTIIGSLYRRRDSLIRALIILVAVSLSLSFAAPGVPSPFVALRSVVPGFSLLRTPNRFLPNAILALSLLAGLGASIVFEKVGVLRSSNSTDRPHTPVSRWRKELSRRKLVVFGIALIFLSPPVLVFYAQNDQYFLGAFRNTPYATYLPAYSKIRSWLESHYDGEARILDLTDVGGGNSLHTLGLPTVVFQRESLLRLFAQSSEFPRLLCKLGIGYVVSASTNFSRLEQAQAYYALQTSELFMEHNLGVQEISTLDILVHRLPPRIQEISIFQSRIPCPSFAVGRLAMIVGGPRTLVLSLEDTPETIPALLSLDGNLRLTKEMLQTSDALVFGQADMLDFQLMMTGTILPFSRYAAPPWTRIIMEGGLEPVLNRPIERSVEGQLVLGDYAIRATGLGASISIPIKIDLPDRYVIVARVLSTATGELFTATLDSGVVSNVSTDDWRGFRWILLTNTSLEAGWHDLLIAKKSAGPITLDAFSIIPADQWLGLIGQTSALIRNQGFRVSYALDPSSLFQNALAGEIVELKEAFDLTRWERSGEQALSLEDWPSGPSSPIVRWEFTSGPYQFITLPLEGLVAVPDSALAGWLLGTGAPGVLTLMLYREDGSFTYYDLNLEFEGWRSFEIRISSFNGFHGGQDSFSWLRLLPTAGRGEMAFGGLRLLTTPYVISSTTAPAGESMSMPWNSSVATELAVPMESLFAMKFGFGSESDNQLEICIDGATCGAVRNSTSPQQGIFEISLPEGYHRLRLRNAGISTLHVDYLKIVEMTGSPRPNHSLTSRLLRHGVNYQLSVDSNLPVAIAIGESVDPNWKALAEAGDLLPSFAVGIGTIGFLVGAGNHSISISFESSTARIAGGILSVGSLIVMTLILIPQLTRLRIVSRIAHVARRSRQHIDRRVARRPKRERSL